MTLAVICCGGTIDTIYTNDAGFHGIGKPAATAILARAGTVAPPITSLIRKDSKYMDATDRTTVVTAVRDCAATRIMITHGTDTMIQTARAAAAAVTHKTVVFVGAFLPAACKNSDADFNVGFALAAAQTLPVGVYIAMNGLILPAETAMKNYEAGRFELAEN